jgi:hypothetical protein
MHVQLQRRLEMEYALALVDANRSSSSSSSSRGGAEEEEEEGGGRALKRPCPEAFRHRAHSLASLREDVAFVNREVDTYNLQVPTLHLQRLRVRLDPLVDSALRSVSFQSLEQAELAVKAAAREGIMGATCLLDHRAETLPDVAYGDGGGHR